MIATGIVLMALFLGGSDGLADLCLLDGGIKRLSSYDRNGGNKDFFTVSPGNALVLADIKGAGTIRRIFIKVNTDDPAHLRSMLLRFYWDGMRDPCVDCPLGDFFGLGNGRYAPVTSIPIVAGTGRGMTCYFPMPFRKRAHLVLVNEGRGSEARVHYQIDYTEGQPAPGAGLFHAHYSQGYLTRTSDHYMVLHAVGKGKYVGTVLSVVLGENGWFGEGDEKFYVDGEEVASIKGTGLSDYFGCAWGFQKGFNAPYFGTPHAGDLEKGGEFTGYRFHINDPITFEKELFVAFEHCGERFSGGRKLFDAAVRGDAYFSVAYWYQNDPHHSYTVIPYVADRISGDLRFTVEGEQLGVVDSSEDSVGSMILDGAVLRTFEPGSPGDFVTFEARALANGRHEISGRFLSSTKCGRYQLSVNGTPVGQVHDFFDNRGGTGMRHEKIVERVVLGRLKLSVGKVTLRFEAVDKDERSGGFLFGIDSLTMRPLE